MNRHDANEKNVINEIMYYMEVLPCNGRTKGLINIQNMGAGFQFEFKINLH